MDSNPVRLNSELSDYYKVPGRGQSTVVDQRTLKKLNDLFLKIQINLKQRTRVSIVILMSRMSLF